MPFTDPVTSIANWYRLILTQYHSIGTNHCCSILNQYTASSPRNAQLSQLDLV